jgi:hypothetical protein
MGPMEPKPTDPAVWTDRHDLLIKVASPEVAAEKLGRTVESVLARRKELGLPNPLPAWERLNSPLVRQEKSG